MRTAFEPGRASGSGRLAVLALLVFAGLWLVVPTAGAWSSRSHIGEGAQGFATTAGAASGSQADAVRLEYIAHAAFVVESPGGTRIAIDPFNSNIWLGYAYPDGVAADAVLVTHPHYDHDATYYFSDLTPAFRGAGAFRVGDVGVRGVASEHVGASRFLDRGQSPLNTMWLIEAGGLRIAHLGDNRLLNEIDLEALGPVDVVLLNAAYFDAPNAEMLELMLAGLRPKAIVPMHYRHEEISELPSGLRPVGEYLRDHPAEFSDGNVLELTPATLPPDTQIIVLRPSAALKAWPESLNAAWVEANEGSGLLSDAETESDPARAEEALWEGLFHFEAAMDLAPQVLAFGHGAADALARLGEIDQAIETLDHAVARAPLADWTDRARAHMLLGRLYEEGDRPDIAVEHYAYVEAQEHTHETSMRERALQRLEELTRKP